MSRYFWQEGIQYGGIGAYRIVGTAGCVEVTLLLLGFWLQWSPLLQFWAQKREMSLLVSQRPHTQELISRAGHRV